MSDRPELYLERLQRFLICENDALNKWQMPELFSHGQHSIERGDCTMRKLAIALLAGAERFVYGHRKCL